MSKDEEDFRKLDQIFILAQSICDPIEFSYRQHRLLHELARHILKPYYGKDQENKDE